VGVADESIIHTLFSILISDFPEIEFGAHFHSNPNKSKDKIKASWHAGCRRFDATVGGFGGCPFASDNLIGNISTEKLLEFCTENSIKHDINLQELEKAYILSSKMFKEYR
jgi:hydroxymethylglutaryl-CoA lyase